MLKSFFTKYSIYVASLMIAQVLLFLIMPFVDFNIYGWLSSKSEWAYNMLSMLMWYIFLFSCLNILVVGSAGIYFLFVKKEYKIASLCIVAAVTYFFYAENVGRDI